MSGLGRKHTRYYRNWFRPRPDIHTTGHGVRWTCLPIDSQDRKTDKLQPHEGSFRVHWRNKRWHDILSEHTDSAKPLGEAAVPDILCNFSGSLFEDSEGYCPKDSEL